MPKNKPTYDDLVKALYDIWDIVDEVPKEYGTKTLKTIKKICTNALPDWEE